MMSSTEFLKIKEKQKAFGMNNGLRVHEVFDRIFTIFVFLNLQSSYIWMKFSFQRGSSDKAVMAFTQGMLVSLFFQLVLRWIWGCCMDGCQSFFFKNFFRQLEQSSGSRLSSLWPNERSITVPTCCSQPSKGTVLTLLRNIKREQYIFRKEKMADDKKMETIPFDPRFPNQNQTRNCWQNYVDFHRCQKIKVGRWEEMTKSLVGMIMNALKAMHIWWWNWLCKRWYYLWQSPGWGVRALPVLPEELQNRLPCSLGGEVGRAERKSENSFLANFHFALFFRAPSPPTSRAPSLCVVHFKEITKFMESCCGNAWRA